MLQGGEARVNWYILQFRKFRKRRQKHRSALVKQLQYVRQGHRVLPDYLEMMVYRANKGKMLGPQAQSVLMDRQAPRDQQEILGLQALYLGQVPPGHQGQKGQTVNQAKTAAPVQTVCPACLVVVSETNRVHKALQEIPECPALRGTRLFRLEKLHKERQGRPAHQVRNPGVNGIDGAPGEPGADALPGPDGAYCPCPQRSIGLADIVRRSFEDVPTPPPLPTTTPRIHRWRPEIVKHVYRFDVHNTLP
ncbi:unnamed protein product, partial [Mesorhabditis spiculigera]